MIKILKSFSTYFVLVIFIILILGLTVRGREGNPTSKDLYSAFWMENGPLELSPERGRYALLYSVVENKSFSFDLNLARFATPDLAINSKGEYVSLFAPGVSFAVIPGYLLGKMFGLAQVGAFSAIALFGLLNVFLIRLIAIRLGAKPLAATTASLVFLFATPALTYAVALYQHHISTFLILSSLYILLRWKNWLSLGIIWLLFAASIPIDYPNLILMLPIALYATTRIIWLDKDNMGTKLNINFLNIITPITMLIPLLFYVWFSQGSYNKPFQLSGTMQMVRTIDSQGKPLKSVETEKKRVEINKDALEERNALSYFRTRRLLNGFYIHFFSPDRGIIMYTPIVLFGIIGAIFLWKKNQSALVLITSIIGADILLYSIWSDPWGGWAFGSRYLIPTYALLSVLIAFFLSRFSKKSWLLFIFFLVMAYSMLVNSLGALTTSRMPPQVEVLALEKLSNTVQKYTYERNWDFLNSNSSKSYVWQTYAQNYMTAYEYYYIINSLLFLAVIILLVHLRYK